MFESGREHGDVTRQGDGLSTLAKLLWHTGRTVEADARAREAVALLEQLPPGRALAMAYATVALLRLNADDAEQTRVSGSPFLFQRLLEDRDSLEGWERTAVRAVAAPTGRRGAGLRGVTLSTPRQTGGACRSGSPRRRRRTTSRGSPRR
jgi:hypothetical protein